MVTVRDEKRLRRTAGILTAVPLFPLGGSPMFTHVGVLTRGPRIWRKATAISVPQRDRGLRAIAVSEPVSHQNCFRKTT